MFNGRHLTNVGDALVFLSERMTHVRGSNVFYFTLKSKNVVVFGDTGEILSTDAGVVTESLRKLFINIGGVDLFLCDTLTGERDDSLFRDNQFDVYNNTYLAQTFYFNGRKVNVKTHHIMALCKFGMDGIVDIFDINFDTMLCINHKNNVKRDNYFDNLEIVTFLKNLELGREFKKASIGCVVETLSEVVLSC